MIVNNMTKWLVEETERESGLALFRQEFNDYNEALYEYDQRKGNQGSTLLFTKVKKELLTE